MSSKREAEETLKVLKELEHTRDLDYVWTRDELAQVAPYYHGSPKRFNISQYIRHFISRTRELHPEPSSSHSRFNLIDEQPMNLKTAVMELFHAICPHPARYYDENGAIDFVEFQSDLGIWLTTITATWRSMQNTDHDSDCECCINFKMLATNYEDMLKNLLSPEEYFEKRVAKNTISRWASGLSSQGAKEGLASLVQIGKSLLAGQEHSMISDLTDASSELSDAEEGEAFNVTYISEQSKFEMRSEEKFQEEEQQKKTFYRRRKEARRPLDQVIEMSDTNGILTLAITEVGVAVQVRIPTRGYTDVGRNEICNYAKIFFQQLVKVKGKLSILEMLGHQAKLRKIKQLDRAYRRSKGALQSLLTGTQTVYTTRSRKRRRRLMLHGDDK